jgi:hypothetical protein
VHAFSVPRILSLVLDGGDEVSDSGLTFEPVLLRVSGPSVPEAQEKT